MTLKTYRAASMAEALAEVKKDLGADAVILHTRSYRVGGFAGIGARTVVEITASADSRAATGTARTRQTLRSSARSAASAATVGGHQVASRKAGSQHPSGASRRESAREKPGTASATHQATPRPYREQELRPPVRLSEPDAPPAAPVTDDTLRPPVREYPRGMDRRVRTSAVLRSVNTAPMPEPKGTVVRAADDLIRDEAGTLAPSSRTRREGLDRLAVSAPFAPTDADAAQTLQDELAAIKRLMGQVLQTSAKSAESAGSFSDALGGFYLRLIEQQVAPDLADRLCAKVRAELSPAELAEGAVVRECLLRHIAQAISVDDAAARFDRTPDGRPLTIALIGPTGVGKTTTLAKLAAICKLRHNKRVGLITCDTYRIAAVEQLRTYANIIGLPIRVAMSPAEMSSACEALLDFDVVLVDTPGRSQHDSERLEELHALVDAARPHHKDLVISAIADLPVVQRTIERFSHLEPSRVILSKLDEGVHFGTLCNILDRLTIPVSFVTTGQEVPDHIEPASAPRLARLILDGSDAHAPVASVP